MLTAFDVLFLIWVGCVSIALMIFLYSWYLIWKYEEDDYNEIETGEFHD